MPSGTVKRNAPDREGSTSQARPGTSRGFLRRFGWLFVAALALLVAAITFDPRIDPEADSAGYIILGKALHAGLGMRYVHLPDAPHTNKFPVGFPLLLAGVEWMAPDSLVARKALVAACYIASVILTFRLALNYTSPPAALIVAVLTAVNPFVLGMARMVMSEIPYLCVSLVALCCLERALDGPQPAPRWAWIGGMAALLLATQLRTIGWSLLLALAVVLILRRRYRTLGLVLAGLLVLVPLSVLTGTLPIGSRYVEIWEERTAAPVAEDAGKAETLGPLATSALSRIGTSAFQYAYSVIPGTLLPIRLWPIALTAFRKLSPVAADASGARPIWSLVVQAILVIACLAPLGLGAWPLLWRLRLAPLYAVVFMVILVFWAPTIPWARHVVPLIPLFLLCWAIGLDRLRAWARPHAPTWDVAVSIMIGGLVIANIWSSISLGAMNRN